MPPTEPESPRQPVAGGPEPQSYLRADAGVQAPEVADGPEQDPPAAGTPRSRRGRWFVETAIVVVVALIVAVLLRTFVVETFYIPSGSMLPTLHVGDRILVDKLSYDLHGVGRGDIVVFRRPPLEQATCAGPAVNDLVKRVIGLPGETISLVAGGVDIDGKPIPQPWLPAGDATRPGPGSAPFALAKPYRIPKGEYFLMGDNRSNSCDSRYWGPIPRSLLVGKVDLRIWPLDRLAFF